MNALSFFHHLKSLYNGLEHEKDWAYLYSSLFEIVNAPYTTFIKLKYFRECQDIVQRFQDIPDEYKTYPNNPEQLFISHKWETYNHPDISKRTLNELLSLTTNFSDDAAVWWDFCSLPQRNPVTNIDDRSTELKEFFKYQLSLIPLIILDSRPLFLWQNEGINSGWCCVEILIAQALLQFLNKLIYDRKDIFLTPPLYVIQVENQTLVQSDLVRFEHQVFQRMYSTQAAMNRHKELLCWLNIKLNNGVPTPYTKLLKQVTPKLISQMLWEFDITFTNGSDEEVVSNMLYVIYQRLSTEPFNSFSWKEKINFESTWHYVKGCLGNCVVPNIAYRF